jgi:hypothetical protein
MYLLLARSDLHETETGKRQRAIVVIMSLNVYAVGDTDLRKSRALPVTMADYIVNLICLPHRRTMGGDTSWAAGLPILQDDSEYSGNEMLHRAQQLESQ